MNQEQDKQKKSGGGFRKFIKWTALVLALIILVTVAAGFWLLRTDSGRGRLEAMIEDSVASEDMKLDLQGLSGNLPGEIFLQGVTVADREGVWLEIRDLAVELRFLPILKDIWYFDKIEAGLVDLDRLPRAGGQKDDPGEETEFDAPDAVVENLALERVEIDERAFGRAAVLNIISTVGAKGDAYYVDAKAKRIDRPSDVLSIEARAPRDFSSLQVNATLSETQGGLVGAMLGLPDNTALDVKLSGSGPLDEFSGELHATATNTGSIDANFSLSGEGGENIAADGSLSARLDADSAAYWRLLGERADFSLKASQDGGKILVSSAQISGTGMDLNVNDFTFVPDEGELEGGLRAQVKNHEALAELASMDVLKVNDLRAEVSGSLDNLKMDIEAVLPEAAVGGVRVREAKLEAETALKGAFKKGAPGFTAKGVLNSGSLRLPYDDTVLSPGGVDFDLAVEDSDNLKFEKLAIRGEGVDVSANGRMALNASSLEADVKADLDEPSKLIPDMGDLKAGKVELTARVTGSPKTAAFKIDGQGKITDLDGLPEAVEKLAGTEITFKGPLEINGGLISSSGFNVKSDSANLDINGRVSPAENKFDAGWTLRVENPEWVRDTLGLGLKGKPTVSGTASGTFKDFKVDIKAVTDGVLFGSSGDDDLGAGDPDAETQWSAQAGAKDPPFERRGRIDFDTEWRGRKIRIEFTAEYHKGRLEMKDLFFAAPQIRAGGSATLLLDSGLVKGRVRGRIDQLSEYSDILGGVSGAADFNAELLAERGQAVKADLDLFDTSYGGITARRGEAKVELAGLKDDISGQVRAEFSNATAGAARIDMLKLNASGGLKSAEVEFAAKGGAGKSFNVRGDAAIERGSKATVVTLREMSGTFAGIKARTARPAEFVVSGKRYELKDLALKVGSGEVTASGLVADGGVNGFLTVEDLALAVVQSLYPVPVAGELDAGIELAGTPLEPDLSGRAEITGLRPIGGGGAGPMLAEIKATVNGGRLDLDASLKGDAKGGGESGFTAKVKAPADFSLRPFSFEIPAGGELSGEAEGVLDLAAIRLFLNLEDQFISGRAPVTASLSGTVSNPDVSGSMRLENARYENLKTGTVIREITGGLELENEKIRIPEIVGSDGQGGKFFARGGILLDGEKGYPYDLTLEPRTAVVLNTDRAQATAHGTFRLEGDSGKGSLSGQVTIDPANIRLPDQTPPEVAHIDVVKVGVPPDQYVDDEEKGAGYMLGLNVDVDIPARFFVRGRGLEAEFQGDLTVNGTASNPDLRGTMSVVRGWFDFIDKRLNLERGNLRFTGEGMMPMLDVVAENRTGDVTAVIHLTGPADDFSLRLTSNPPLPDNEIMSRLLFGRRAGDLNPVQAVQLADALRRLSGRGGGPGLVAEARRSLGLDQLNISGGGQGPAPAVGVGKYVREDVYLEVQRDFSTGGEEVSVEVELTPRIGVTGSASQLGGSQVGLNYKINY